MPAKLEESWNRGLKSRRYCRPPPRSGPTTRWAPSLPQWQIALLLIAGLIQALLTQASSSDRHGQPHSSKTEQRLRRSANLGQARNSRLTTVRQPLRYISWFVLTARSRLARGPSRPPTPGSPRTRQAPHQHRHCHVGRLVAAPPQRRHLRSSRF